MNQAKDLVQYLYATKNGEVIYETLDKMRNVGYSDADWAGKLVSRNSTSSYWFFLNERLGAISWNLKVEAEAAALFAATQELSLLRVRCRAWYKQFVTEFCPR